MDGVCGANWLDSRRRIVSLREAQLCADVKLVFFPSVWVQLLDRLQKHLEIVLLSRDNFASDLPYFNDTSDLTNLSGNSTVQVIYAQDSQYWINVHDLLHFLPSDDPNEVRMSISDLS